jgi:hypothetical protein
VGINEEEADRTCLKDIDEPLPTTDSRVVRPVGVDGNCALERIDNASAAMKALRECMLPQKKYDCNWVQV